MFMNGLEDKKIMPEKVLLNTLVVEKKNIICTTLYSFNGPFQGLQSGISYISFLVRSAVDSKFCLIYIKNLYIPHENSKSFCEKWNYFIAT